MSVLRLWLLLLLGGVLGAQQEPGGPPDVVVGGPADMVEQAMRLVRDELGGEARIVGSVEDAIPEVAVLFAFDEIALRRLAAAGSLAPLLPGIDDLAPAFRGDGFGLTLVAPWTLAFDRRVWRAETAPPGWEELPFATAGENTIGVVDPAIDPVPLVAWLAMQWEQGFSEDRAFGWLAALDARVEVYAPSAKALLADLEAGRVSLAPLPLHLVRRAAARGAAVGHRFPREGLPASAFGVAVTGPAGEKALRIARQLLAPEFTRRAAVALGLLAAPRAGEDDSARPAAERELLSRLLRPPAPEVVDRWLGRFEAEIRGRGGQLEQVDTLLELIFGVLFAGFLFFVYLRIRRSDAP